MQGIWEMEMFGIVIWRVAAFFGIVLAALVIGKLIQLFTRRTACSSTMKSREYSSTALHAIAKAAPFVLFAIGFQQSIKLLALPGGALDFALTLASVLNIVAVAYLIYCLVDVVDTAMHRVSRATKSKLDDMLAPMVRKSLRITIVALALVQIADRLSDEPVTTLLAGLGVGGLAVALAAQETIKNFFGTLVILGDKPFQIGDRIVVDGHDGPVEEVGFRSTKIRTLEGHLVTVPNGELANKTIHNIGKRPYIRRVANITITYDTPPEKVKQALEIVKNILNDHEGMHPDYPPRVYFSDFNDWSLNLLVIYWYHPPNYWDYLAFTERVNQQMLEQFNEAGIEFAFPTQTLYVNREEG